MTMAKVLVLDDVMDAGILIKTILKRKGHEVFPFTEEEDALNFIAKNHVDLAILDMKLKKMSGIEVLEEIRKLDKDVKVIMLTGYPTIETARQALNLGASEYCVKPIDKNELEDKVASVLEG
jgi:DNA-binding NtrC family response regulator